MKLLTAFNWTLLGTILGWAAMSTYYIGMSSVTFFVQSGSFPSPLINATLLGAGLGLIYGLYKAGVRIYLK